MKKISITAVYKHNIVYKNIKHKNVKTFALAMCVFVVMFTLSLLLNPIKIVKSASGPINELYHDVQSATFVSGENITFILPLKTDKIENKNSCLCLTVTDSIMVISPANGEIVEISKDLNKTIKIKCTNLITISISGVNVCGVTVGQFVKQGKEIATVKQGDIVQVKVFENNKIKDGLYVYKSFIKWD